MGKAKMREVCGVLLATRFPSPCWNTVVASKQASNKEKTAAAIVPGQVRVF
jgi:hypothetical protein